MNAPPAVPPARPACNGAYFVARTACPVCLSRNARTLYAGSYTEDPVKSFVLSHYKGQGTVNLDYLAGTDFIVDECGDCGTVYQRHVPNDLLLDKIYNEFISQDTLYPRAMRNLTLPRFEFRAGELIELFSLLPKRPGEVRFLDYGFGYGSWSRIAVAMGAEVCATEISAEKIAYGSAIGVKMVDEAALAGMQFDIVHTEQVFEHLLDPHGDFLKLGRLVAPGGIMKVSVPPAGNIRGLLAARGMSAVSPLVSDWQSPAERRAAEANAGYMCIVPLEHVNVLTEKGVRLLAREAGLRLIGTVRQQAVPVSTASAGRFIRSLKELGRAAARVALRRLARRDWGYYVLRRD
ncbi:MAG TPA: class I SAM-dependent methyltransferase [Dongiaceae bacterium]|nr:class I SAM-dependent methyltransferase [Dongiaceae bacterium]